MSDGAGPSGTAQEAPASDAAERAAHDRAEEAAPASSAHPADGSPAEDDPHAPLPPIPPGSEGGVFVVVDGESVYIPPDPDFPPPAPGSADAGAASSGPVPVFIPVWEMGPGGPPTPAAARAAVEQAQRELRAAVAQGRVIGLGRARPMVLSKSLKLADAFLAAGFPEPAEALYQHVFEWAGADYGGRSALARGGAEGLARIYRARGEDAKAEWILREPAPTPVECVEMAWGGVLGAFAQIPGAWDGLVRALTPPQLQQHAQQKGPSEPPAAAL